MTKDYVICHKDPFELFKGWCPGKLKFWHTHPCLEKTGDHLVTLYLTETSVRDELEELEQWGVLTCLPTMTSGNFLQENHVSHPTLQAAGVTTSHRTWDAAKLLLKHVGWPPLHPDR